VKPVSPVMNVSVALTMPRARFSPADDLAREIVARSLRVILVTLGLVLIAAGALIAPLPGPWACR
jgi:hypothetical protein